MGLTVGVDIGSVSMNVVVLDDDGRVVEELPYKRHFGRYLKLLPEAMEDVFARLGDGGRSIDRVVFTGTHGITIGRALDTWFEVETTAAAVGLASMAPDARSVISIGGHDSAFFTMEASGPRSARITHFRLNEACAAGTGSFIDQQAERIYADDEEFKRIEDPQERIEAIMRKFIEEGSRSDDPAPVACRCTVFTKSDMIHLQNRGIKIRHIIKGLHEGVARNYKSTLITNHSLPEPVYFIGGYSLNPLAVEAFRKILGVDVHVPKYSTSMGALGVALKAIEEGRGRSVPLDEFRSLTARDDMKAPRTEPLSLELSEFVEDAPLDEPDESDLTPEGRIMCYMGLDVGSTTTKLALVTPSRKVVYKRYIPTEGQPVNAVKKALRHLVETRGGAERFEILGVGTTGSGREVAGLFVGADDVVNEVTAHAKGSVSFEPRLDTIFELGGQDAKYTSLRDGFVVDFRMNKVCAAGTGSFLEETANKLGLSIDKEYEREALSSKAPLKLAERCTVYMEADLMSYLQQGAPCSDLLAGLAYAVVHNYLNRVVGDCPVGECISFQGGPSLNKAVVAAFEKVVGKRIITLPHREVMGAIGAALHAAEEMERIRRSKPSYTTRFYGFEVIDREFVHEEEICERNPNCHNRCKLQIYRVGEHVAVYGGDCGMYETRALPVKKAQDFHRIRRNLYFKHMKGTIRTLDDLRREGRRDGRPTIGIPRTMHFHQLGLFWARLFTELGFDVITTPETDQSIVDAGIASMTCEACFPIKISHGHTAMLKDEVDYLFIPELIEMDGPRERRSFYCPYQEANYYMLKAALGLDERRCIHPVVNFKETIEFHEKEFSGEFTRLGLRMEDFRRAWAEAEAARRRFERELVRIGKATLDKLGDSRAVVVVSRPYSLYDARTNLNLFQTFSKLGVTAIPMEFLDLDGVEVTADYPNMYWGFGDKILRVTRIIKNDERLFPLYLTSFGCGPDSFILHFFNHEMNRMGRPYLELELDEHSAGAGVETRLLAYIDVMNNYSPRGGREQGGKTRKSAADVAPPAVVARRKGRPLHERTVYIPWMAEGARLLAAAFRALGIDARVMPTYSKKALELGKRHTSGKECFPCTVTTGDMLELIENLGRDGVDVNEEIAFFMPETEGPCRFGQYNRLHRILLDSYGYDAVPILSPSSEDSYRCSGLLDDDQAVRFRKLGWEALCYSDIMEKALWRTRPYECNKGETDSVFEEAMRLGERAVEAGGGARTREAAERAAELFGSVRLGGDPRPLVGIVGEIYVRTHKGSNQDLVRELESLGLETITASIAEWVEYTTYTSEKAARRRFRILRPSTWKELVVQKATRWWQRHTYVRLMEPFERMLEGREDHPTEELLRRARGLVGESLEGEAILSVGGALTYAAHGCDGVINAMPFTCMPSTIATSVLKVVLRDEVPYIDMVYDGTILPNRWTNLSTFAYQVKERFRRRLGI